jgi:membrane protein implicated in regulation of membrane protease activity
MAPNKGGFATFIGWAWKVLLGVLAIAGGVASVASPGFRRVICDAAERLYPFPLVILLVVVSLALLAALVLSLRALRRARRASTTAREAQGEAEGRLGELEERAGPGRADHDVGVLRTIRQTLPRSDIDYWRDLDLGGVWHGEKTHHLMQMLYDHNAVEDRLLDPELETLRVELMDAVGGLMDRCARYGAQHKTLDGAYELADAEWRRDNPPDGERYERFEARREELNQAADKLVDAYDSLRAAAQPRLPLAFNAPV